MEAMPSSTAHLLPERPRSIIVGKHDMAFYASILDGQDWDRQLRVYVARWGIPPSVGRLRYDAGIRGKS